MITWTKPNGTEVTTNELPASTKAAKTLGWKRKEAPKPAPKKAATKTPAKTQ